MKTPRTLLAITFVAALAAAVGPASAQDTTSSAGILRGSVQGHAYRNGGIGTAQAAEMARELEPYDLQLALSEGRDNTAATGVKLTITLATGQEVFFLVDASPVVDVDLPTGYYHVLADFGRIKRMADVEVVKGRFATLFLHARSGAT